ncbi:MAG: hypothetical protein KGY75_09960 [Candidatus Cloacimonetes bacterium]|nr:hypothetical protein [Candidatus Cloacimonadota bacterium]
MDKQFSKFSLFSRVSKDEKGKLRQTATYFFKNTKMLRTDWKVRLIVEKDTPDEINYKLLDLTAPVTMRVRDDFLHMAIDVQKRCLHSGSFTVISDFVNEKWSFCSDTEPETETSDEEEIKTEPTTEVL